MTSLRESLVTTYRLVTLVACIGLGAFGGRWLCVHGAEVQRRAAELCHKNGFNLTQWYLTAVGVDLDTPPPPTSASTPSSPNRSNPSYCPTTA